MYIKINIKFKCYEIKRKKNLCTFYYLLKKIYKNFYFFKISFIFYLEICTFSLH